MLDSNVVAVGMSLVSCLKLRLEVAVLASNKLLSADLQIPVIISNLYADDSAELHQAVRSLEQKMEGFVRVHRETPKDLILCSQTLFPLLHWDRERMSLVH